MHPLVTNPAGNSKWASVNPNTPRSIVAVADDDLCSSRKVANKCRMSRTLNKGLFGRLFDL